MTQRERVKALVESAPFHRVVIGAIVLNAVLLGLMTSDRTDAGFIDVLNTVLLGVFVIELALRLYAHGWRFFRDPWNVFDLLIVGIALVPATGSLAILRALRIFRALRLITAVPSMRRVVRGLFTAIPGMLSIVMLLCLVLYVSAVLATELYGATAPQYFGDLGTTLFTLFQVMTGEAWPDIARELLQHHPTAWIFFVLYILVSTFVVLNLFTAVVVSAMESEKQVDESVDSLLLDEVRALRVEIAQLRADYDGAPPRQPRPPAADRLPTR
ncbi:ion transporter [Dactylosporangium sp. NPDC051485]|uniref:ion transporter n=1 Tax=Dactylosporangium sp. NPDC051485 TaxID=3154846 RepID=UPI003421EA08